MGRNRTARLFGKRKEGHDVFEKHGQPGQTADLGEISPWGRDQSQQVGGAAAVGVAPDGGNVEMDGGDFDFFPGRLEEVPDNLVAKTIL